jgi:hypothetical protein
MSGDWNEAKYVSAQNLWFFIDELANDIDLKTEDKLASSSESYRLLLLGRREMLDRLVEWMNEEEIPLSEILQGMQIGTKD